MATILAKFKTSMGFSKYFQNLLVGHNRSIADRRQSKPNFQPNSGSLRPSPERRPHNADYQPYKGFTSTMTERRPRVPDYQPTSSQTRKLPRRSKFRETSRPEAVKRSSHIPQYRASNYGNSRLDTLYAEKEKKRDSEGTSNKQPDNRQTE